MPEEPAPKWRSCSTDDDCELKSSTCAALAPGDVELVCRRLRLLEGAACRATENCELGLNCFMDRGVGTCTAPAPCSSWGPCVPPERKPLSCDEDAPQTIDAHCELE